MRLGCGISPRIGRRAPGRKVRRIMSICPMARGSLRTRRANDRTVLNLEAEMAFRVGQKVVCVDASAADDGYRTALVEGAVYTIAAIDAEPDSDGNIGLTFSDLVDPPRRS